MKVQLNVVISKGNSTYVYKYLKSSNDKLNSVRYRASDIERHVEEVHDRRSNNRVSAMRRKIGPLT